VSEFIHSYVLKIDYLQNLWGCSLLPMTRSKYGNSVLPFLHTLRLNSFTILLKKGYSPSVYTWVFIKGGPPTMCLYTRQALEKKTPQPHLKSLSLNLNFIWGGAIHLGLKKKILSSEIVLKKSPISIHSYSPIYIHSAPYTFIQPHIYS
jgi:hypothetical protein